MTKAELIKEISNQTGCDAKIVSTVVENFMMEVKESLKKGENVTLRGFGSFIIKKCSEKTARNISQNTTVIVPARCIAAFKASKELKRRISKLKS